jgi:paired amphipathic helix protein Sin3a
MSSDNMSHGEVPTMEEAIAYVEAVKDEFQDEIEKYDEFLNIMMDFKAMKIDTSGVIARLKDLFKGHTNLILGFNIFVPKGSKFDYGIDPFGVLEEAKAYVHAVKVEFQYEREKYDEFVKAIKDCKAERIDTKCLAKRVKELFKGHTNLTLGFNNFLPKKYQISTDDGDDDDAEDDDDDDDDDETDVEAEDMEVD